MCGLAGVVLGQKTRTKRELSLIRELFTDLLVLSEHRGPFATGAAMMKANGTVFVKKAPLPASEFVETPGYRSLMDNLDSSVTCLMGHARWPTRGTHLDNRNNHPLVCETAHGAICLTHNGTVTNAAELTELLGLTREAEVDSEVLLRLAERNADANGVDLRGLLRDIRLCAGRLSFVVVAGCRPGCVILVRGNQPLVVRSNHRMHIHAYVSEPCILDTAGCAGAQWTSVRLPPWHALVIDSGTVRLSAMPMLSVRREHHLGPHD